MKTKKIILSLFLLVLCIIVFMFILLLPKNNNQNDVVSYLAKIPVGVGGKYIANDLAQNKVIRSKVAFYLYVRFTKPLIKAGVYPVSSDMSVKQIVDIFVEGKQSQITVAIPEGLTMRRIGLLLENQGVTTKDDFLRACNNKELLAKYSLHADNFEGFLFPDTYYFTPQMDGEDVVSIMVDNFFEKIKSIVGLQNVSTERLYYILTLASIVEREYRVTDEAPLIASVFSNRLRRNIGLYSCATVEYIITEINNLPHPDVITYTDLKIDSPYNTYLYAGLPPTPISNPGLVALKAAANPPRTTYYYFRLVDSEKGSHYFSTDFEEHTEVGKSHKTKTQAGK